MAHFELSQPAEAAQHFIHGARNRPRTADLLIGRPVQPEKSYAAVTDYNEGISLIEKLHGFLDRQSLPSKRFFKALRNHAHVADS